MIEEVWFTKVDYSTWFSSIKARKRVDSDGAFGGNNDLEHRMMNPNGLIPTIRDGDCVVWDGATILRYLAAHYGDEAFWPCR